jgi:hypothetical protein
MWLPVLFGNVDEATLADFLQRSFLLRTVRAQKDAVLGAASTHSMWQGWCTHLPGVASNYSAYELGSLWLLLMLGMSLWMRRPVLHLDRDASFSPVCAHACKWALV